MHRGCNVYMDSYVASNGSCFVVTWIVFKSRPLGGRPRATFHTRLRARDHSTSSTLIGGKGRASSSSLHTMLEGPTEYVNARWV
jgi:hypothetical protein